MRLRYDKVALRFIDGVREAMSDSVPDRATLVVTITAPIRLASKTQADVVQRLREKLALSDVVHSNHVRAELLKHKARNVAKVAVFVHNAETDPGEIVAAARKLLSGQATADTYPQIAQALTASAARTPG